jgi:hypothetical protein
MVSLSCRQSWSGYSWSSRLLALITPVSPRLLAWAFNSAVPRSLSAGVCAGLKRRKRGSRGGDDSVRILDTDPFRRKECLAESVRDCAGSTTCAGNIDGMFRSRCVQFRFGRTAGLRELGVIPSPDTCNELSCRNYRRNASDRVLQLRNREGSFNATSLVTGIDAGASVMNVGIEKARG